VVGGPNGVGRGATVTPGADVTIAGAAAAGVEVGSVDAGDVVWPAAFGGEVGAVDAAASGTLAEAVAGVAGGGGVVGRSCAAATLASTASSAMARGIV